MWLIRSCWTFLFLETCTRENTKSGNSTVHPQQLVQLAIIFSTTSLQYLRLNSSSAHAFLLQVYAPILLFFKLSLRFKETRLHQVAFRGSRVKVRANDLSYCNTYIYRILWQVHCFTRKIPSPVYSGIYSLRKETTCLQAKKSRNN